MALAVDTAGALAGPLVSNLSEPAPGGASVVTWQWLAGNFTTGSNPLGYQVDSAVVDFGAGAGGGTGFFAAIYNDSGFTPGSPIANGMLAGPTSPGPGQTTYTTPGAFLSPSTNYWLVLGVVPDGSFSRTADIELTGAQTSAFGFAIGDIMAFSVANGGPWAYGTGTPRFQINGAAVPEPASAVLLALGFLGIVAARVRRV